MITTSAPLMMSALQLEFVEELLKSATMAINATPQELVIKIQDFVLRLHPNLEPHVTITTSVQALTPAMQRLISSNCNLSCLATCFMQDDLLTSAC